MIDDLGALRAFVAVVEAGSFSAAGRRLRVVPSTISKHVAELESRVSGQLVIRSTKRLSITELGSRFYDRCLSILHEVEETENEIGEYNAEPQGLLRVSAATVFTTRHMTPILVRFLRKYPKVRLDISLSTSAEDIVADGIDVAIRISNNLDPGLIALKLAPNMRVYCAAPDYLARHGTPGSLADLAGHNCLVVRGVTQSARWPQRLADGSIEQVAVSGSFVSDNGDLVRQALLEGLGIGHLARFMVDEHIRSGELVELFPESREPASNIYAVYAKRKNLPLKTRAFLDHLRAEFATPPSWAAA
ncbi:LysR family transcriptional regulator [Sphingomonas profundi]|uniref:LysR family transcriptional regulator n=1 Tax=Alterirhizorhabdus profundi TaxID=2681549 RepID=UPI001E331D8C|nr:LysR family transcriptional regulator [Sphingomonas profundi]